MLNNNGYFRYKEETLFPYLQPIKEKGAEFARDCVESKRQSLDGDEILFMDQVPDKISERLKWEAFQAGAEGRGVDIFDPAEIPSYAVPYVNHKNIDETPKRWTTVTLNKGDFYCVPHLELIETLNGRRTKSYQKLVEEQDKPGSSVTMQIVNDIQKDLYQMNYDCTTALYSLDMATKVATGQVKIPTQFRPAKKVTPITPVKRRTIMPDTDDFKAKPSPLAFYQRELHVRKNAQTPEQRKQFLESLKRTVNDKIEQDQAEKEKQLRDELKKMRK